MARLKAAQLSELRELHEECATIVRILAERGHLSDTASQLLAVIDDTSAAQNLRGMRAVASDLVAMLQAPSRDEQERVESDLERRIGRTPRVRRSMDEVVALTIVARGRIRNDREYYVLRNHLERLQGNGNTDAAATVTQILDSYRAKS